MTASVTELAPSVTLTAPRLPATARRGELQRLAREAAEGCGPSSYVLGVALRALVHQSIPDGKVREYWRDYLNAVQLAEDVDTGFVTWQEVFPELCNGGRQDEARDITREGAEAALCLLINGIRTKGGN